MMRASQLGGDKVGDVARFMPPIMAQLKGSAFGNERGFKDAAAMLQIVKRVAGTDEAAGIDVNDLLVNMYHQFTKKRFAAAGIDLVKLRRLAYERHIDPAEVVIAALRAKTGDSPTDPNLGDKVAHFFRNQQAGQAALALLLFDKDQPGSIGYRTLRRGLDAPNLDSAYRRSLDALAQSQQAGLQRAANAKDRASITTGDTLNPLTRALNALTTGSAGALDDVQGGLAGRSLVRAAAIAGAAAAGVGKLGQVAVGVATPIVIGRSLMRMTGLGARAGAGRVAGAVARAAGPRAAAPVARAAIRTAGAGATTAAQAAARSAAPAARAAACVAARGAARASLGVAGRTAGAAARATASPVAGVAARLGLLGRVGGFAARLPLGELLMLPGVLRDLRNTFTGPGHQALAWATGDRKTYQALRTRFLAEHGIGAPAPPPRPLRPAGGEPGPNAPVGELAAFARGLSADAAAMIAHARAMGALAGAEIAAVTRLNGATPALAIPAGRPPASAAPAARQVVQHFNIHGSSDPKATGWEAARVARAEEHRALHDGADG